MSAGAPEHTPRGFRDDRGNPVRAFDFESIRAVATDRASLRRLVEDESSHPTRDINTLWLGMLGLAASVVTLILVQLAVFALFGWFGAGGRSWKLAFVASGLAVIVAAIVNAPARNSIRAAIARRRASIIAHAAAAEGFCGGCAYPLDALDPEPDGCTVCPECGAAWRIDRPAVTP